MSGITLTLSAINKVQALSPALITELNKSVMGMQHEASKNLWEQLTFNNFLECLGSYSSKEEYQNKVVLCNALNKNIV